MTNIRDYIDNQLLEPLKNYPTAIQDTLLKIIGDKLEELYNLSLVFPEIVSPNSSRIDILSLIAEQFVFKVREEAELQEQVDILTNILYVYTKRGTIDTIEHMWKYYGGDLPREVEVVTPLDSLFTWNMSKLSCSHVFQDSTLNRTGIYEIKLTNNTYPLDDLKEFLIRELVAAGNFIYFTNKITLNLLGLLTRSVFDCTIYNDTQIEIMMAVNMYYKGLTYDRNSISSTYSGILGDPVDLINIKNRYSGTFALRIYVSPYIHLGTLLLNVYKPLHEFQRVKGPSIEIIKSMKNIIPYLCYHLYNYLECYTSKTSIIDIEHDFFDKNNKHYKKEKYFILAKSLLGKILYKEVV